MIRSSRLHPAVRLAHAYRLAGLWAAACILFLVGACDARAQFSGPATSSTSTYNQELTATTDRAILYPGERDIVLTIGDNISIRLFSDHK
jgi:polysaccharide export outer membrane protein